MKRWLLVALSFCAWILPVAAAEPRAKNVVLFLADAAGIPTVNAASRFGYGEPRRLFVQRLPFIGLSETSTASEWVTDSAAGMTAIVTGVRTHNGVIGQGPDAVRGSRDGTRLKTLLDYAEEHGLGTGIISNDSIAGATPAALYAHVNERSRLADIVVQAFESHGGDGIEVLIGSAVNERAAASKAGTDLDALAARSGRPLYRSLAEVPADARRAFVFADQREFELQRAVDTAIVILSRHPNGYFLMVESDAHTDRPEQGLRHLVEFDRVIERVAQHTSTDTLMLFTADHSFDLRIHDGRNGDSVLAGLDPASPRANPSLRLPNVRIDDTHTGEEVLVGASGPGSSRVRGYFANTDLFHIMLDAWGWK
jgi:alkaline phosphatase